jgi:hypothetical protein
LIKYSKEEIIKSVFISDIADRLSVSLEQVNSGNFTHRCKCPARDHKNGSERTCSLYVDNENNNFYCFGCGASNNAIDFYMLCKDVDFSTAIQELSEFVDPTKIGSVSRQKKVVNFPQLLKLSVCLRDVQKMHPEDIEWIEDMMKKTDKYIEDIDRHDVSRAKNLLAKVKGLIHRRYSNK